MKIKFKDILYYCNIARDETGEPLISVPLIALGFLRWASSQPHVVIRRNREIRKKTAHVLLIIVNENNVVKWIHMVFYLDIVVK